MKFLFKNLIFLYVAITFFNFLKNENLNSKILASEYKGVDINFGDSIGVNQNILNLKNRKKLYKKEIIEKVKQGGAIDHKMGKAMFESIFETFKDKNLILNDVFNEKVSNL